MKGKLYVFIRYHVEIRALQGNSTLILQTCCRYYDKWTANCMSSFVILSKNLRFTKCLPWFSVQFMCIHSNSARFKETLPWFSVQFMCIHSNFARFKETLPWFFKRVVDTTINELQTPLLLSLSRRKNLRFKETLPGFSNLLSILR